MKIRILKSAQDDLMRGYRFYEQQRQGLGDYFLDALFADIDSLQLYAGMVFIKNFLDIIEYYQKDFLMLSTIK